MSGAEIAWIVAAGFFGLGVVALCVVLFNVFRMISQINDLIKGVTEETVPLINGVNETVSGINVELARLDTIVAGVQHITATADSLVSVVHAAVSNPLIKVVAYAAGAARGARSLRESDGKR